MEMEKSYYVLTCKPAFSELARTQLSGAATEQASEGLAERLIVAITQGGFGQDVVDDERQAKERFLEYLFEAHGIDLPRSEDAFDEYFELEQAGEFIDLDEEV